MVNREIGIKEIMDPSFISSVMDTGRDHGRTTLVLGSKKIKIDVTKLIFHVLLWRPLFKFNILPTEEDLYFGDGMVPITSDLISGIQTRQYKKIIRTLAGIESLESWENVKQVNVDHEAILLELFYTVGDIYNFQLEYCGEYVSSLDAVSLCQMSQHPKVKKLADVNFSEKKGSKHAERELAKRSKELIQLLSTRGEVTPNPLLGLLETGCLHKNQLPQTLLAYGARSDIDDIMMKYPISESAVSGLKNVKDFATEYLSGKKASYFTKEVIKEVQYFARKLKLVCAPIEKLYFGDCGSKITVPITITDQHIENFIDKEIIEKGKRILLTADNIKDYVNKTVNIKSPLCCKYTDGFCESCAGRGPLFKYFMPPDIHVGKYAATQKAESTTQKVLSAKHLIKTLSKMYTLPDTAKKFFWQDEDQLFMNTNTFKNLGGVSIVIPIEAVKGPITDLGLDHLPGAETFTSVDTLAIVKKGKVVAELDLKSDYMLPYVSEDALVYLSDLYEENREGLVEGRNLVIPMDNFNIEDPFMKFIVVNDDMVSYVKRVKGFVMKDIRKHKSLSSALTALVNLVYDKASINIFYLEVVLKTFLITSENDYRVPVVEDPNVVKFASLNHVVNNRDVPTKLSYERRRDYFEHPMTYVKPKEGGFYSPMYGMNLD